MDRQSLRTFRRDSSSGAVVSVVGLDSIRTGIILEIQRTHWVEGTWTLSSVSSLEASALTERGGVAVTEALKMNSTLIFLNLRHNWMHDRGASTLAE